MPPHGANLLCDSILCTPRVRTYAHPTPNIQHFSQASITAQRRAVFHYLVISSHRGQVLSSGCPPVRLLFTQHESMFQNMSLRKSARADLVADAPIPSLFFNPLTSLPAMSLVNAAFEETSCSKLSAARGQPLSTSASRGYFPGGFDRPAMGTIRNRQRSVNARRPFYVKSNAPGLQCDTPFPCRAPDPPLLFAPCRETCYALYATKPGAAVARLRIHPARSSLTYC